MNEVIKTAGLQEALAAAPAVSVEAPSPRREAISLIRSTLRKVDASDDEVDDALEALLELAKD
jgi:hypothetical protein